MLTGLLRSRRGSAGPLSLPAYGGEGSVLQIWGWGHRTVNVMNCSLPGMSLTNRQAFHHIDSFNAVCVSAATYAHVCVCAGTQPGMSMWKPEADISSSSINSPLVF